MLEINKIYCGDCLELMKQLPDKSVDLTVTSPPYDNLRTYEGFSWDFEGIAKQLFRVTKDGGVIVWVVGDATVNGSETGTSFKQALYFKEIGFNIETMIWEKTGNGCLGSNKFYGQNFEYMFIFIKGVLKTSNLICDRENKIKKGKVTVNTGLDNGRGNNRVIERKPFGKRSNIWRINQQQKSNHPAPFPLQLAIDHIISWSNTNDLILDPFVGSGTTCIASKQLDRNYIGMEISQKYCDNANERLKNIDDSIIKKDFEL